MWKFLKYGVFLWCTLNVIVNELALSCDEIPIIELIHEILDVPTLTLTPSARDQHPKNNQLEEGIERYKFLFKNSQEIDEFVGSRITHISDKTRKLMPSVLEARFHELKVSGVWVVLIDSFSQKKYARILEPKIGQVYAPVHSDRGIKGVIFVNQNIRSEIVNRHEIQHIEDIVIYPERFQAAFPDVLSSISKQIVSADGRKRTTLFKSIFSTLYLGLLESRASWTSVKWAFTNEGRNSLFNNPLWARELFILNNELNNLVLASITTAFSSFVLSPLNMFWVRSLVSVPVYWAAGFLLQWVVVVVAYPSNILIYGIRQSVKKVSGSKLIKGS